MTTPPNTEALRAAAAKHLWMANRDWAQMAEEGGPLIVVEADGIRVTDSDGKSWIDVNGGYISINAGHGRTEIADAAFEQMRRIAFMPPGTTTEATVMLAAKLAAITPEGLTRVFPVSGGSEANETALKIARSYHERRGEPGRFKVISRKGSYHGATGGVQWLGNNALREADVPTQTGLIHAPQPDPYRCELGGKTATECAVLCAEAVEQLIIDNDPATVSAVIAEPVTARGCIIPGDDYWPMLRDICDHHGVLLIADEVITGFGRTGKMFAIEHSGVVPDILNVAKGIISSYLPFGATITTDEVADVFVGPGNQLRHVFTATGHPVCSAAALKNIEIIEREGLVDNSATMGAYFKEQLEGLIIDHMSVGDARGIGLLLGVELVSDRKTRKPFAEELNIGNRLTEKFKSHGLLLGASNSTLNIGPPLSVTKSEIDEIMHGIDLSLWELEGELGIGGRA
jgi:adenosylmethionine-8-amino-7-oxononanoate aminotransferase